MLTCAIDRFLAAAAAWPGKAAVRLPGETISYAAFEARVRGFAGAMQGGPNVLIALPQGPDAYAAMLGAGLAGCFYTPVNSAAPMEKLRRIAGILQPDVIVAAPALGAALAQGGRARLVTGPGAPLRGPGTRHEIAYVIFTSGSTGAPKGVVIGRAALNHFVGWVHDSGTILADDRVSQFPNIAFDVSVTDIYGAFGAGATLCPLLGAADRIFPARAVAREGITVWNSTPSVLSLMMRAGEASAEKFRGLRLLNFCGEPLLPGHVAAVFAAAPRAILQNAYGPTETTVTMTQLRITPETAARVCRANVAIGAPIPGMALHLLGGAKPDEGEIVVTGPQLALGYWGDAVKTAAAFRMVAIEGVATRGYFTGDWAERRGLDVFFRERMDHQVKIRGFRLELDEVAQAIHEQGFLAACVLKFGEELAAVIEESTARKFDEAALRAALAARLEAYAVPKIIKLIKHLPRTDNDKLDRQAVAAWLANG
jgi:D-alanine--poly(phosphoribitol) ligase subunit 1